MIPYSSFQSFFSVFTQISPVLETLGWNIFVMNFPFGGLAGNSSFKIICKWNDPPSKGVPSGPIIQASIVEMFVKSVIKIPSILFFSKLYISFVSLCTTFVGIND